MRITKDLNRDIFLDTMEMCKTSPVLAGAIEKSVAGQRFIGEEDPVGIAEKRRYESGANVIVSQKRSFEAASAYKGKRVCVLNFASPVSPGGGVKNGARAQEESLCRCSTLYPCLSTDEMLDAYYIPHNMFRNKLGNDDIIYTPGVKVFKTDEDVPVTAPEEEWFDVNVITCAAPDLYVRSQKLMIEIEPGRLMEIHEKRLRKILDVALSEKNEVLILGAFGCGAFRNPPEYVALASRHVLPEYMQSFETIEYAIAKGHSDENFTAFYEELIERGRLGSGSRDL